ncbi:MAG: endolytic transglycosylase MltG [Candidatus Zambryskibacteria bacterium]|nr:endolytic transglycosylase MltG [Candidatus Zambryskibacteria bacterium]
MKYIWPCATIFFMVFLWRISPPVSYPQGSIITVSPGSLYEIGEELKSFGAIRSPFWFRIAAIIVGGERNMKAGQYKLTRPQNVFVVAWRVARGERDIETAKITIPEGFTVSEISSLFDARFQLFDRQYFLTHASEGYLFPDTYFIPVTATASSTIKLFTDNFDRKTLGLPVTKEVIVMASLLESEAKTEEERKLASGILWKRLKLGMPLQVDSAMNTYEFQGLPEAPINNPGLVSINAALNPKSSPYLYFLTDKEGKMHYARTFDEHKTNIAKYLR